jgi:hypothetical protein
MQQARGFHPGAQTVHALLDAEAFAGGSRRGRLCLALHVAAGTERVAGAGQDEAAHVWIKCGTSRRRIQRVQHVAGERVARFRAVQREGEDAVGKGLKQLIGHGCLLCSRRLFCYQSRSSGTAKRA